MKLFHKIDFFKGWLPLLPHIQGWVHAGKEAVDAEVDLVVGEGWLEGFRLPTPPTQPHPPGPTPENHLSEPLPRWDTSLSGAHHPSKMLKLFGNVCKDRFSTIQPRALLPSCFPSSFNSRHHSFSSFISHFIANRMQSLDLRSNGTQPHFPLYFGKC